MQAKLFVAALSANKAQSSCQVRFVMHCWGRAGQGRAGHGMAGQATRVMDLTQGPVLLGGKEAATSIGAPAPDSSHSHLHTLCPASLHSDTSMQCWPAISLVLSTCMLSMSRCSMRQVTSVRTYVRSGSVNAALLKMHRYYSNRVSAGLV